jgi:protein-tyrosine phosphatase
MAEGILKHCAQDKEVSSLQVDSCGTAGYHVGQRADSRAIETLASYGIDITTHRARQFSKDDFAIYDRIYAMDNSNLNDILALTQSAADKKKVKLILNELSPGSDKSVGDPYYGGQDGFENVYSLLMQSSIKILEELT